MTFDRFIRQSHRWLSIAFTVTVIANFVALGSGVSMEWLYYLPLPPLFLLMSSGLYLYVSPYLGKRRGGTHA